ncbi:putative zinc transport system zinc-binding lipoprotein AdcA precursor [Bacteroidales bacterium Barb6XT]|nr:putative zinc transport system zinc-binding lipoprotein AdcA precursor [Bacteroidales bacterium Barb6XT]
MLRSSLSGTFFLLLFFLSVVSCETKREEEVRVVSVTIEPQRYFAEKVGGEHFKVNVVVPAGQSPETYDPVPRQMMEIGRSTAYLQIGCIGFEQAWMENICANNPDLPVFDLSEGMDMLGGGKEDGHDDEDENGHHHNGADPHIWSSIQGARIIAGNVLNAFVTLDEKNRPLYEENYIRLVAEIEATADSIARLLRPVLSRAFIIYHPALTYFAEDFNLTQLCIETDGKEPSPAQLMELTDIARNHNARIVFVQQEFDTKNAEIIARETGCRLVRINPLAYDWPEEMIRIAKALSDE